MIIIARFAGRKLDGNFAFSLAAECFVDFLNVFISLMKYTIAESLSTEVESAAVSEAVADFEPHPEAVSITPADKANKRSFFILYLVSNS